MRVVPALAKASSFKYAPIATTLPSLLRDTAFPDFSSVVNPLICVLIVHALQSHS